MHAFMVDKLSRKEISLEKMLQNRDFSDCLHFNLSTTNTVTVFNTSKCKINFGTITSSHTVTVLFTMGSHFFSQTAILGIA